MFHPIILKFLRSQENGYGQFFNTMLSDYNKLLRTNPNFQVPWPDVSHSFNTTLVGVPDIDAETQAISFAIDGTIYDNHLRTSHVGKTYTKANLNQDFEGNQIFVHQTVLASLLYAINSKIMPYSVVDKTTSLEIVGEFLEIKKHYGGKGTSVNMTVTAVPSSGDFLNLDSKLGFVFGRQSDLFVNLELYCSNESQNIPSELCIVFEIKMAFNMNVTIQDFNMFMSIGDAEILDAKLVKDVVGMRARDYRKVIQHILNYAIANFNYVQTTSPIDLKPASTWIPLIREVVSLSATPYV